MDTVREGLTELEKVIISNHNLQIQNSVTRVELEKLRIDVVNHNLEEYLGVVLKNHGMKGKVNLQTLEVEGEKECHT